MLPISVDEAFWDLSPNDRDRVRFAEIILDPTRWLAVAQDCRVALECLWPAAVTYHQHFLQLAKALQAAGGDFTELYEPRQADVRGICLMLAGYAAENLCKAVMIARLPEEKRALVRSSGRLRKLPRNHDLVAMLDGIDFPSGELDRWQAWRLSRAARWYARYPVPLDAAELGHGIDGRPAEYWMLLKSSDQVDITDFLSRLQEFCFAAVAGDGPDIAPMSNG